MECNTFVMLVEQCQDPRHARGCRFGWAQLLWVIAAAMLSDQATPTAISQWVWEHAEVVHAVIGPRLPSSATLRRTLQRLDVEAFAVQCRAVREAPAAGGLQVRAVDGKTVRGASTHGQPVPVVSEVVHGSGQVIQQGQVATKSNEIPLVQRMLAERDLHGLLLTVDAMHTQRATARSIIEQGGQYLMVVKDHQPELHQAIAEWFAQPAWNDEHPQDLTTLDKGHGRRERRTLHRRAVIGLPWEWPGVQQVLQRTCVRTNRRSGVTQTQVTYGITSLPWHQATAAQLEGWWRGHWHIENKVHYVRDVTWREDAGQSWVGNTPVALTLLRNWLTDHLRRDGWTNIAQALRHFNAHPLAAFRSLGILS